ncbi:B2 bradykinin receptor [Dunckerocampus dactyliophorus]|uniref:B2 bradykinin receptor n=1 Tax=Dunckerocampus dactyliophorus TaxID=161453 RepID=UPI002404F6D8|nr:B2 bradykinin receptor [Dunckerocampus dactyliophorus]
MALQTTRLPELSITVADGNQNSTNETQCINLDDWDWLTRSQPVYLFIITALGIVLNAFVLLVFCLHKKACTVAEIYLSNLAAADLLLVSCLPFWAVHIGNGFNWPFGVALCKVVNAGIKMNAYCSIYFLVLVSMDRHVALVHPMSHGRMRRPKYAKLGCLLVWGLGLFMSAPTLVFRAVRYFPDFDVQACFLDYPSHTVELICDGMLIIFSFIIPISIIAFCTVTIIRALKKQSVARFNAEKSEQKATTLVLVVLVVFLICWVPLHFTTVLDVLHRTNVMGGCRLEAVIAICNQIFAYLAFFNSVINPILYVIVGKNFRKKVQEVCKQWAVSTVTTASTRSNTSATLRTFT